MDVAATDAAGMNAHENLIVCRTRLREINELETRRRGEKKGFHWGNRGGKKGELWLTTDGRG
jgi:hypothetical protein